MIVKAKVMVVAQRGYYTASLNSIGIGKNEIYHHPISHIIQIY